MHVRFLLLALLVAAPSASAQHAHPAAAAGTASAPALVAQLVTGLRVDEAAPPPGSAVARTSLRWADGGYASVVYGRPYRRGRVLFGGVVGYGAVWVAGAHQATELWTTVPLVVGGAPLAPGGYSLFVTPHARGAWTVHVNRALGMHLADDYDPALDVAVVNVRPEALDAPVEGLTWAFTEGAPDGSADGAAPALTFAWERTRLTVPLARPAGS